MAKARQLQNNIQVVNPDTGLRQQFTVGTLESDIPTWARERITNPNVWREAGTAPEDAPVAPYGVSHTEGVLQSAYTPDEVAPLRAEPTADGEEPTATADAEPAEPTGEDLSALTKKELLARAKAAGVEVNTKDTKSQVIKALQSA